MRWLPLVLSLPDRRTSLDYCLRAVALNRLGFLRNDPLLTQRSKNAYIAGLSLTRPS